MIKYSTFHKIISEALTDKQKKTVDTWEKGDNSFSDHLFDHPKHTEKTIPLEHPDIESEHHESISSHLAPHGIKVKDYKSGIGEDKHGREVKIGKALEKTKAPDELKNKFANDPSRSNKGIGSDDLRVTISRHPHHVAGMTSRGQCWEQESCMNFDDGQHKGYLKRDVKHGTHVAYLHHKDDKELEHPLARIALKKFIDPDSGHEILRPEGKTYGPSSDAFRHTVHKFINDKMAPRDDGTYYKDHHIYNDDDNRIIVSNPKTKEDKESQFKRLQKMHDDDPYNSELAKIIGRHDSFDTNNQHAALDSGKQHLAPLFSHAKKIDHSVLDRIISEPEKYKTHLSNVLFNKNIKGEHLDKLLDKGHYITHENPHLTSDQLHKNLRNAKEMSQVKKILSHPNANDSHTKKALSTYPNNKNEIINNAREVSEDTLRNLEKNGTRFVNHKNYPHDLFLKHMEKYKDEDGNYSSGALGHHSITTKNPKNLEMIDDKAETHPDPYTRKEVDDGLVQNYNTPSHILKKIHERNPDDEENHPYLLDNPNTPKHIKKELLNKKYEKLDKND